MAQAGFPSTTPALTMTLQIGMPVLIGSVSRGNPLTVVPITGGTLRAEPSLGLVLDGNFIGTGNDYIHNDAGGRHMRLDAHAVVRDQDNNHLYLKYYGVIDITPELTAILGGSEHARSTDFGHQFIHVQFESGNERYRDLETGIFVGAGRFLVDRDAAFIRVEYKISRVTAGPSTPEAPPSQRDQV